MIKSKKKDKVDKEKDVALGRTASKGLSQGNKCLWDVMGFSGACIDLLHAHSQSLLAAGRHTSAPQLSLVRTERPPVQKQISRSLRSQLQVILMDRGSVISVLHMAQLTDYTIHGRIKSKFAA